MKKIIPVLALFLLPSLAICCSCLYSLSFCELLKPTTQVATVRIFDTHLDLPNTALWIDVVLEETLQGTIEHDTMTILASSGTSCDPGFEEFQIGENLIVYLKEAMVGGTTTWYTFRFSNGCQEEFLHLKDNVVIGFIEDEYEMRPYEDFKNSIGNCANYTHTFDKEEIENFIHLYPVPTASAAFIELQILFDYDMTIFTTTGQMILHELVIGERRHPLDISDLPNGLYFVRLKVGKVTVLRRLLVQR